MMRRGLVWPIILVLAAALLPLGAGCAPKEQAKKKKPKPIPTKTVGLKQPIEVGAFKYELLSSEEATHIGSLQVITSARSRGRFVILHMRAELVGSTPRTLDRREVGVVDSTGKAYQSSQDAQGALAAQGKKNFFKQDTTYQGIPVDGWMAFDVGKKAKGLRVRIINLVDPKSLIGYVTLPVAPAPKKQPGAKPQTGAPASKNPTGTTP